MAGALTEASHRRSRSNSYSPRRRPSIFRQRYCIALCLCVFFALAYLRRAAPPAGSTASLQQKAYNLVQKPRPTCPWSTWHMLRYSPLSHSTRPINTYLAMNLYQNEEVLPTFFQELPIIINHLGPRNVFVSIYENNSEDKTQKLLGLRAL
jgi:alpha-1,3-mannosyltransferase